MNVARQLQCTPWTLHLNCALQQLRSNFNVRARVKNFQVRTHTTQTKESQKFSLSTKSNVSPSCLGWTFPIFVKRCEKLLSANSFCKAICLKQQRSVTNKIQLTMDNANRNVRENVLVFSQENDSFYKFLSFFGIFQMLLWGYLSLSPVQNLRTGPVVKIDNAAEMPWWKRWLYKEGQYKNALTGIFLTVGASILFVSVTYPRRAVKSLWLLKGGQHVKIITHSPFKSSQSLSVPLDNVNCVQSRTGSGSQIPLKIKDKAFFFLMDKQGTFHHPEMFDFVIGLKRKL